MSDEKPNPYDPLPILDDPSGNQAIELCRKDRCPICSTSIGKPSWWTGNPGSCPTCRTPLALVFPRKFAPQIYLYMMITFVLGSAVYFVGISILGSAWFLPLAVVIPLISMMIARKATVLFPSAIQRKGVLSERSMAKLMELRQAYDTPDA